MESIEKSIFEEEEVDLVQASSGKRLANYLIDLLGFYVFLFSFWAVIVLLSSTMMEFTVYLEKNTLLDRLITLVMYGLYMGVLEMLMKGRSFGKLITGTAVMTEDGTVPSATTLFLRGIARSVPFEALSALGNPSYPWHDKWTETLVINLKKSRLKSEY
ncbi:RDD family protein [Chitinophaga sp. sic0106]|uniref:RDD family protein n=1 Tax=Chitinophaga sp. sic0106 TaxID=2854785 RepID=UPI001C46A996|nr:RDD family protein [Chitinophaga sp. sic0106]MBV7531074.1 RDD family protein [Chitinophaga sp. sic0106]